MSKQTEHTTTNEQTTSLPQPSEDDAQKMMESMFSALLQNPGTAAPDRTMVVRTKSNKSFPSGMQYSWIYWVDHHSS